MNIEKTEIDDVYIVKNLLSKEQHAAIYNCICYFTRWDFNTCTQNPLHPIEDINGQSYFSKMFFNFNPDTNNYYESCEEDWYKVALPLMQSVSTIGWFRPVVRIKANLYTKTENIIEHSLHVDYPPDLKSPLPWNKDPSITNMVYMVNTIDGYTEIFEEDGKDYLVHGKANEFNDSLFKKSVKAPSVENTAVIFSNKYAHRSTSTTNSLGRFTINCNFV